MIIDAWIQHPTPEFLKHPMFGSLRRWMVGERWVKRLAVASAADLDRIALREISLGHRREDARQ